MPLRTISFAPTETSFRTSSTTASRRQAAAASANKRDHAIGAAVVAAVLDFQDGAGAVAARHLRCRSDLHTSCAKMSPVRIFAGPRARDIGSSLRSATGIKSRRALLRLRCWLRRWRSSPNEARDFGLMRISDNPGDAVECGEFFGRALRIAACHHDSRCTDWRGEFCARLRAPVNRRQR